MNFQNSVQLNSATRLVSHLLGHLLFVVVVVAAVALVAGKLVS